MIIIFQHKIKLENEVITELLKQNQKRGLYLYLYSLRAANERKFAWINLKELMNLLGLKSIASNKKTLIESFKHLDSMNLVSAYSSYQCEQAVEWDNLNINEMFYLKVATVTAEEHYTLINDEVIDSIIYNANLSNNEDALAIVILISRMIERKVGKYQVCFPRLDLMISELRIAKSRCIDLLKELVSENIIGCEKVKLKSERGSEKEHNIYAMSEDIEDLNAFVKIVVKENRLGKDLKTSAEKSLLKNERLVDGELQHIWSIGNGEYDYSLEANNIIKRLLKNNVQFEEIDNERFYSCLNKWCQLYDFKTLSHYITDTLSGKQLSNPVGYLIKMLPIEIENYLTNAS